MADNPAESATENASDPAAESSGKTKLPTANSTAITAGAPVLVAAPQEGDEEDHSDDADSAIGDDKIMGDPVWCPPNLTFEIDDATQDWTFAPNSFDYVHIRYMLGSIQDWPRLFKQAYTALKPGGYVESYESEPKYLSDDGTVTPDSAMSIWTKLFADGGKKLNRPFTILTDNLQQRAIEEAGFIDIQEGGPKTRGYRRLDNMLNLLSNKI
ncbi:putative methyltransferase domain-containing protein [Eutypa lata UCREL1]|uniref:Putative methyltransferase domain-containing protein n=1 Tax=Eutypa lata (strain UCR-EL1) TaxID=1287681 RepID=M7STI8_EUTLA|nr:putative methyltransferase domain-containing protein [Eutypa lata UCREL1]